MANNLSIRHLRAFVAVAQHGSFTRAAEHLYVTQSSLTATIKQLEQQTGLILLDRTTRRVLLNHEGERFLPVAERLLSDFDTAVGDLQAVAAYQHGKVGIAVSPSTLSCLLPPVIKEFHSLYPHISLLLRDDSAAGIEQHVLANHVDFGIGGNHSEQPELSYFPLLRDRYGVVLAPDHPLAQQQGAIAWQELKHEKLLMLSTDTGIRAQLSRNPAGHGIELVLAHPSIEVSNPAGLAALIDTGLGLSILPALAAGTHSFEQLRFRPLDHPAIYRDLYIIHRLGRSLSPAADVMLQLVRQKFSKMILPPFVEAI
jgi:DNA-binding transcriptional LysR family regulator